MSPTNLRDADFFPGGGCGLQAGAGGDPCSVDPLRSESRNLQKKNIQQLFFFVLKLSG